MLHVSDADGTRRGEWDAFVAGAPTGSFLQSWPWGLFQEAAGFPIRRILVTSDNPGQEVRAVCLFVERPLPFGQRFLYAPWGPVIATRGQGSGVRGQGADGVTDDLQDILLALKEYVEKFAERSPVFIRIEPRLAPDDPTHAALAGVGFPPLGRGVQPKDTLIINLLKSEDDLLRGMHPKTRYNIRIAIRHGVTVDEQTTPEGLRTFLTLARDVERRGRFRYHPETYYETMLRTLSAVPGMFRILVASHAGVSLATALFIAFGGTMTYAHGASSAKRPYVMASTLLHWEAIRRAKELGMSRYDFFGIAPARNAPANISKVEAGAGGPAYNDKHPWAGITRFKRGFSGDETHFVGIADAVLDPVPYRFYTIARGLRDIVHH